MRRLGDAATLNQAVEFFLNNSLRSELKRTVSEVVEEFVAMKQSDGLSERYVEDVTWRLRRFAKDFQVNIEHVTTRDLDAWLRMLTTGLMTRVNFRKHIVTLFNYARRRGYLPRDPETEARWREKPKIKSKPIEVFSPQELSELIAAAEGQVKLAIIIGAFTGIRSAEMLRLKWENFNWGEDVIDIGVDQTKTASRRLVPTLPALVAARIPSVWMHGHISAEGDPLAVKISGSAPVTLLPRGARRGPRDESHPELHRKHDNVFAKRSFRFRGWREARCRFRGRPSPRHRRCDALHRKPAHRIRLSAPALGICLSTRHRRSAGVYRDTHDIVGRTDDLLKILGNWN